MDQQLIWRKTKSTGTSLLVLLALDMRANEAGVACVTTAELCGATGMSASTVSRCLKVLEQGGEIERQPGNPFCPSLYRISLYEAVKMTDGQIDNASKAPDSEQKVKMTDGQIDNAAHPSTPQHTSVDASIVSHFDLRQAPNNNNNNNNNSSSLDPQPPDPDTLLSRVHEISEHFQVATGVLPSRSTWEFEWRAPIEMWLSQGNVQEVKTRVDLAVQVARGKNEAGKVYRITSPRSLNNFMANLPSVPSAQGQGGDPVTLWKRIVRAVTDWDFTGLSDQERVALKSVGVGAIKGRTPADEPKLQARLFTAYSGVSA